MSYLYGTGVQGIQRFIFQTNKLKDIVRGSEVVEAICTTLFRELFEEDFKEENLIIGAAGNVRYLFDDRDTCARIVRTFPRRVMTTAPGIVISQAVVEYSGDFAADINRLEDALKAQRNQPPASLTSGALGLRRSPATGLPIVHKWVDNRGGLSDPQVDNKETWALAQKSFYGKGQEKKIDPKKLPFDVSKLTQRNDWIAVIHADGNGLGQVVQKVGSDPTRYKSFSKLLDKATEKAANDAYAKIAVETDPVYPLRPVILGGDDMTVIIRGDLAIDYAKEFMRRFEFYTSQGELGKIIELATNSRHLTACAGVAFIKSSYPFYYGYKLAEELCSVAKKEAKSHAGQGWRADSCLMFHKVEDSFVQTYDDIQRRELRPTDGASFKYGPYYLHKISNNYYTIDDLQSCSQALDQTESDGVKTGLRRWISVLHKGENMAQQHLKRMKMVFGAAGADLSDKLTSPVIRDTDALGKPGHMKYYPVFDVLSYHSITSITTREERYTE